MRVGKLENGKAIGKDEITREMIKGGGNRVVDWIWKLCNMAFENGAVLEDWRSAVIIPLYKGKLLNSIKSMYINSLACIRVKGGESEYFRVDNGVRRECIISLWLFNIYMDAVMKEVKMEMGGGERDCLAYLCR